MLNLFEMSEIIGRYGSGAETGAGARVHIETFGCTANAGDTQKLRAILKRSGYQLVTDYKKADCVIVNTCTVTKRTELNVVKRLEELKKQGKHVIVAGCMAAAQPELVKSVLGEDTIMITPEELYPIMDFNFEFDKSSSVVGIIPIAMGCSGECTYCIVKRARGKLKSQSPDRICSALRSAVAAGVKEIRITAQDCAAYGFDRTDTDMDMAVKLPELLRMLPEVEGDFRIRIGMMNPFTLLRIIDELLEAFESDKVFKFFHIPVQSGSDKVLSDMRRNYKVADFVEIVRRIRRRFHYCTICTDFIVGFPTEGEDDFQASMQLLEEIKPEKVNITRFSPRPGTEASKLKDMLARDKKMRSRTMSAIYHRMALEANNQLIGAEPPVLVTERGDKGGVIARDPSYKTIILEEDLPPGSFHKVRVKDARSTYLVASVIS